MPRKTSESRSVRSRNASKKRRPVLAVVASGGPPLSARNAERQRSAPSSLLLPVRVRPCAIQVRVCGTRLFLRSNAREGSLAVLSTRRHYARGSVCFAGERTRVCIRHVMPTSGINIALGISDFIDAFFSPLVTASATSTRRRRGIDDIINEPVDLETASTPLP
jgi:hypothetical protein